jgi:hypothetical protein
MPEFPSHPPEVPLTGSASKPELVKPKTRTLTEVMDEIKKAVDDAEAKRAEAEKAEAAYQKAASEWSAALDHADVLKKEFESLFTTLLPAGAMGGRVRVSG